MRTGEPEQITPKSLTKGMPDVWNVNYILAAPTSLPRFHALGSDALPIVQAHVNGAAARGGRGSGVAPPCARGRTLRGLRARGNRRSGGGVDDAGD